jgi:hypothetical protein
MFKECPRGTRSRYQEPLANYSHDYPLVNMIVIRLMGRIRRELK